MRVERNSLIQGFAERSAARHLVISNISPDGKQSAIIIVVGITFLMTEKKVQKIILAVLVGSVAAGCAAINEPSQEIATANKRELTAIEKQGLARSLSMTLKDPNAAQFKWMPVVLVDRDGITDYCGLVNGKNGFGGFTGFVRFYAQLKKDEKGRYTAGALKAVEQPGRETNMFDPRWLNGICEKFGYVDFDRAD